MANRRDFLKVAAGATAGLLAAGAPVPGARAASRQVGAQPGRRREVLLGGRRIRTVDLHAHCFVPEVWDLVKDTPLATVAKANLTGNIALGNPQRLIDMDAQGIDYQAINVNAWGYSAERALARDLVALQNEKIAEWCRTHPQRFVGMATVACSIRISPPSSSTTPSASWDCEAPQSAAASKARSCRTGLSRSFLGEGRPLGVPALHAPAAGAGDDPEPALSGRAGLGTPSATRSRRRCSSRA